ncbi:MAG: calcium-binding protein [Sandaracinaceae bacterium]|nr:calcium-binding protein [Sandaracinaceae bacterium]
MSTDPGYSGRVVTDVSVTNTDNDTAGVTVTPTSGLVTTEAGSTATFTVVLVSQPTADVTISLASSDATEGTVSPASLTFTSMNWNAAQTVTVTGANDAIDDGDVAYSIVTGAAASTDGVYSGMAVSDVTVTTTDNDATGITVTPTSGLVTTEALGTATFTIVLTSQPTADVSIALSSSNVLEGTIAPASLTFTSLNWNVAQTVTVTGVNDFADDGDIGYTIITGAASSADATYGGMVVADVTVTNTDNDAAGVTVTPTSGLVTTEALATDSFTIVLTSQPTAGVSISLTSSNTNEGTVSPASVSFTTMNWNVAQTVTVTGVNDFIDDGNVSYTIITGAASSADVNYNGRAVSDVTVSNTDDDATGVTVTPTSGLTTTEAAAASTFTIVLTSQPTADVTIALTSSDTTEGTVSPASVTFTNVNWNIAQTVTITGVDDAADDGDIAYSIVTGAASSTDGTYSGRAVSDVTVTNTDNDTVGITVTPTSGLVTSEAGGMATFTVVLTSQPSANVTIALSSTNTLEGTVSPASLTFMMGTWNVAQTVTVTGIDDAIADGNIGYTITTGAAVSADLGYSTMAVADVSVTNNDNDAPGITVNPTSGLVTTEAGGMATFTVVLASMPTAGVTISIASSNTLEGTASTASVVFTTMNWNMAQTVTITGINDALDDGDVAYNIVTGNAVSGDPSYSGRVVSDVGVTNTDNDSTGITVTPTSGLTTTEALAAATFTIVLTSQPTANVTISLMSNDTTEGTVSPASVVFTNLNWNVAQTVTVTGVNDFLDDGDIGYSIVTGAASSTDGTYGGAAVSDVTVTNTDNDAVGVTVTPTSGRVTTELLGTDTFTVVLTSQPSADVTISLTSNDTTEGTVSPASVTFTSLNWNMTQTVTVTGVNDFLDDGDIAYSIVTGATASADGTYNGLVVSDVSVTNTDNDAAGITVTPTSGLVTTEALATDSFTVVLTSQPTADVTISLTSNDTTEGTVSPASVTFTSANWNSAQTVTVTGVNDSLDDGDVAYSIVTGAAASSDGNYNARAVSDVSITNTDNDTASVTVTPTSGLTTTEALGADTFTIVLTSQPSANVTITLTSNDTTEGTVSPASVTFTNLNWNMAQTVTVTGVNDSLDDGNIAYSIVTGAASSADGGYNGLAVSDVSVTNTDDDAAGITVAPTSGLVTTEALGTATFTVVLTSQPTADVTISLSSSDATEGSVGASITFTSANWSSAQTVTVTGVDDGIIDGDIAYTITTEAASSSDPGYSMMAVADVSVTNTDNDAPGVIVTPTSGLVTTEAKGQDTFTVVLNTLPTANVSISLTSNNLSEGTVLPASVTFTTANWSVAQTVTITGVNDMVVDGDVAYSVVTGAATSTDLNYGGMSVSDVSVTNRSYFVQQEYIKASNTTAGADYFGSSVVFSSDGNTMVVGAYDEDGAATGIGGDQSNQTGNQTGAVYVFTRSGSAWTQQAYMKASNTGNNDRFGEFLESRQRNTRRWSAGRGPPPRGRQTTRSGAVFTQPAASAGVCEGIEYSYERLVRCWCVACRGRQHSCRGHAQ